MGRKREVYTPQEKASDQYRKKILSSLDVNKDEFSALYEQLLHLPLESHADRFTDREFNDHQRYQRLEST